MKRNTPVQIRHLRRGRRRTDESETGDSAPPQRGESLDTLFQGKLRFYQATQGYRFSLDSLLLADFVALRSRDRVVDLGTGNGLIALILAHLYPTVSIVGVEIQRSMAERARRNVRLNGFQERIAIEAVNVCAVMERFTAASFDAVVCNPPYRRGESGRWSPSTEKQIARHEIEGTLGDFVVAAAFLLASRGRFACIQLAERAADLITAMRHAGLEPKRLRAVHSFVDANATTVLVEGVRGGRQGLKILPPLLIYDRAGAYTAEVAAIIAGAGSRRRNSSLTG